MLGDPDWNEIFASADIYSQDSSSTDQYHQIEKLKAENSKIKCVLNSLRSSTREVLKIVNSERLQKDKALRDLENVTKELQELQNSYKQLDNSNVNNQFKYKESLDELENKHKCEHQDYVELAQDYFNVLSEATTFYNFDIKKDRNKILNKTSKFLVDSLGDEFKKPRLVVRRSSISSTKSTASKRSRSSKDKPDNVKKRKFDIWEMNSISEASSPMSFHDDGTDESTKCESEYSFKTFSIGNETAFSSLANKRLIRNNQCNCRDSIKAPDLVSIGVNTDSDYGELPRSMPTFIEDAIDFSHDDVIDAAVNSYSQTKDLPDTSIEHEVLCSPDIVEDNTNDPSIFSSPVKPQSKTVGTLTENLEVPKATKDQATSPIHAEKCSKSTSTVHSVTHRGTMTPGRVTRNIGVQFPDITLEKILEEMSFDLPNCISPIFDEIPEIEKVVKSTKETQTDLQGVNREIDYKIENSVSSEEQSFIILGQTVFNLFMNRLRETNKSFSDDAHTRQRLREQLLDRFDELTFDDYFNPAFVSGEAQESVLRKVFEDVRDTKVQKKSGFEESALDVQSNIEICSKTSINMEVVVENGLSNMEVEVPTPESIPISPKKCTRMENTEEVDKTAEESAEFSLSSKKSSEPEKNVEVNIEVPVESALILTESNTGRSTVTESQEVQQNIFADLQLSSSSESECSEVVGSLSGTSINSQVDDSSDQEIANLEKSLMETDEIMKDMEAMCPASRKLISPIADLTDLIWSSVFPEDEEPETSTNSPLEDSKVLEGYIIDHQPVEIPFYGHDGIDCPFEPPSLAVPDYSPYDPIEIPLDCNLVANKNSAHAKTLEFNQHMRLKLVTWQQNLQLKKNDDKRLCKIRKSIFNYLNSDWTDENLMLCVGQISNRSQQLLVEAIFETVEDNVWDSDINVEFTPPAPPLPRYQQKLIVLISKLSEFHPTLPHELVSDLEMRLFKCENSSADLEYLRNMAYYYTSLIDLFFDGDPTIAFYFIIKCIYFYGYKAIPMIFVVIKAFPQALPKKSILLKKYSKNIDWETMTGLEMSKIRLDLEWMDSLDLCVMYLMTNIQMYRRKGQEFKIIYEHELFNYLPKMYGFPLSFIAAPKLLDLLVKRIEDGELKNLSMSFILLGKRMNKDFTVRMLLKGKLMPLLKKYVDESLKSTDVDQKLVDKICLLIECISTILKPLTDEKDKSFNEIFPMIVNVLGRCDNQMVQESCIKAILRLQRFIENHKEIYEIIKHHYEKRNSFSESLRHAIVTFIHRKKEAYFKE